MIERTSGKRIEHFQYCSYYFHVPIRLFLSSKYQEYFYSNFSIETDYLIIGQSKALRPPDADTFDGMIDGATCNCPLDCEETVYSQEISQASIRSGSNIFNRLKVKPNYLWQLKDLMEKNTTSENKRNKLNQTINDITSHGSVVHFYFKETGVVLYNRDELYGIMDLVGKILFFKICH